MCIKKVHLILYFFDALPDMLFMLEFISLSFSVLHLFTSINIVQGVKSCSWIFLYGEIVVTLHCHRKSPPSPRSVPPPFQVRFKSVPYIEDIAAKRKRKKKASSPWFICSFYKQRPERPTSSQPNGNALGGQGVGVISPCKGKSPISRQCFCPFRAKKNINHESTGRCPGLRAVALSGR